MKGNMKILALLMAVFLLCTGYAAGETDAEHPLICISVRGYGDLYAELYPDMAPLTVENFLNLVDRHFYDGLTFHRIISGFMIQGGDPRGNGTGGSDEKIKGEFSANGVENPLKHTRGILSMARSQDMDSASCQFFIMHGDAAHLDGNYAAFGQVTSGLWIVDRICQETPVQDRNGTVEKADQPVIETIRRATAEEARGAARQEAMNGRSGTQFQDRVTPLAFPVPPEWNLGESVSRSLYFFHDGASAPEDKVITVYRENFWDKLSSAYKESLISNGLSQAALNTDQFQRGSLLALTGLEESLFAEETHSGMLFYTAEGIKNSQPVTYYVGAKGGFIYVFALNAGRDHMLYPDFLGILDSLEFRETF